MLLHEVFALRIREARERLGLTQAEVAERVDIATEAYGRLERGLSLPRVETLVELSRVLGVSITRLLGLEHEASAPDDEHPPASPEGTPERRRVLRAFDLLTERGQRLVAQLVEALVRGEGVAAAGALLVPRPAPPRPRPTRLPKPCHGRTFAACCASGPRGSARAQRGLRARPPVAASTHLPWRNP